QYGTHTYLTGGGHLQIAEKQIAGRIAPAQEASQPTEIPAYQGKDPSESCQCGAQCKNHSRVVVQVGQCDNQAYRKRGHSNLLQSLESSAEDNGRPVPKKQGRQGSGSQRGGARSQ